jgi:Na+/H+ antiporter NhaD/arsenite permease-like protein
VLGLAITAATIGLVVCRPRGLPEGWSAVLGAAAMVALGVVPAGEAGRVLAGTLGTILLVAVGANAVNNLPIAVVMISAMR